MENILYYAKRLADYVRLGIETGTVKPCTPIAIAYADFMTEWKLFEHKNFQQKDTADQKLQCPNCGLREPMDHKCLNCEHEFNG